MFSFYMSSVVQNKGLPHAACSHDFLIFAYNMHTHTLKKKKHSLFFMWGKYPDAMSLRKQDEGPPLSKSIQISSTHSAKGWFQPAPQR